MRIAVLGTGIVGRTLAEGLAVQGHEVVMGTRDVSETLARTEPDAMGNPPFSQWQTEHSDIPLITFAEAAAQAEVVINATAGVASLAALEAAGSGLEDKVLIDVANPLDFSKGFPPTLSVANTDSLAEQIQRAFPSSKVVKSLSHMNARLMIDPGRLPEGHEVFLAGNDDSAKETLRGLLKEFGWQEEHIIDLGGIEAARGIEMMLPLWLSLLAKLSSADFSLKLVTS
ncbi:MAG: NAD(P)-binding domain-containing protein [Actinomycetota bacterium]|nr:NAD(P)-binding domain-containing protein [Actinomycetota bacterium]